MAVVKKIFQYGDIAVSLEAGELAKQATGSVVVDMDGTTVLVTVVAAPEASEGRDFFPLTVEYRRRSYADRRIPGGYFKREGRPTERETLTARLVDRPIRPLFPEEFRNEVQVIVTVLSSNPEIDPDIPAIIGASAALAISGIPFQGPIAAARVGYKNGQYLLNPKLNELADSELDLVVAGTDQAVLMVESEAKELSEEIMLGAVLFGHQQMQVVIQAIRELVSESGGQRSQWNWQPPAISETLKQEMNTFAEPLLSKAYLIRTKVERNNALRSIRDQILEKFTQAETTPNELQTIKNFTDKLEKRIVREQILNESIRIDGRDTKTVRPIEY